MTTLSAPRSRDNLAGEPRLSPQMRLARQAWLLVAAAAAGLFVLGLPTYFRYLTTRCLTGDCEWGPALMPSPDAFAQAGMAPEAFAAVLLTLEVLFFVVHLAVAVLLFWRAPGNRVALLGALFLVSWGVTFVNPLNALVLENPGWRFPVTVLNMLGAISFYAFILLFPTGWFVPRAMRHFLAAWAVIVVAIELFPTTDVETLSPPMIVATALSMIGLLLSPVVAQVYRYWRVSSFAQRQQTRWVVFGFVVSIVSFLTLLFFSGTLEDVAPAAQPSASLTFQAVYLGLMQLIPLSIMAAILQSRLWAIDVIIRRTLVYAVLTSALALLYFGSVLVLQQVFTWATGQARSPLVVVLSTLAIAAVFSPLRQRVQEFIDRRFYRRKYDAARAVAEFGATSRDDVDLDTLTGRLLAVVDETMQPEHLSLWVKPVPEPADALMA